MVVMKRKAGKSYGVRYETAPLKEIANREHLMPAKYFDRRLMLPTSAFRRYALPLVGPGLPKHFRLD